MGLKLLTDLDAQTCLRLAWRTAQDQGYSLKPLDDCATRFTATKGNLVIGVLAGALAPRCVLEVAVASYPDANELIVETNTPWISSGIGGVRKIRRQAEDFLQAVACAIEKEGAKVLERKEF